MTDSLPIVGCSARYDQLGDLREWLLEKPRPLELSDPTDIDFVDREWRSLIAEIKALLNGFEGPLGIHGPFRDLSIAASDPLVVAAVVTRLRQSVEFAHELGASMMVVHSPFMFFGKGPSLHTAERLKREIDDARTLLELPLREAQAAGVTLVVENICDIYPHAVNQLVETIDHPCLKRSIDTGHAHLMQQRGGPSAAGWVEMTGELLAHVHLADNDGAGDLHWEPGTGSIDWSSFFKALKILETKPRLILELKRGDIPTAHQWLLDQGFCQ